MVKGNINQWSWGLTALLLAGAGAGLTGCGSSGADNEASGASASAPSEGASAAVKPALSVTVVQPQSSRWPATIAGTGSLAAWQEAVIGAELAGQRLTEVRVNVGDVVRRGQVLALLQRASVEAEVNSSRAAVQEAQASLAEARLNAERARTLRPGNAISVQEAERAFTAEKTSEARLDAAKAQLAANEVRLAQTQVLAPDDGIISARSATLGSVVQPGQELFRLIRQQRLEWRAEVPAADLGRLRPGMPAQITTASGATVRGKVRMVAPTVDTGTRNGLVYVDLPVAASAHASARAGMFATGQFEVGQSQGLTLPQSAVVLRDGFSYVFVVQPDQKVTQAKVHVGRRVDERIEITQGLQPQQTVVASGGSFLADGDAVKVLNPKGRP